MLTFAMLAQQSKARCESPTGFKHKLSDWSLSDWFTALVGEVGEAGNIIKKLNRIRDGVQSVRDKVSKLDLEIALAYELADIQIYLDLLAQAVGINLESATILKFNMVSADIGSPIRLPLD